MKKHNSFDLGDFEITYREILASISIVAVMLLIGFVISGKISQIQDDKNAKYNKAVKIESTDLFRYGMDTNVGNAFVYGELKAVDTVTYPEIGGEYMYVEKIEEHYNRHTRTYTTTDGKGHTRIHTEVYWSWDYAGSEDMQCKEVLFCGVVFDSNKIKLPSADYIDTIKESGYVRYKYYGTNIEYKGTIFTELKDKTISDSTHFYEMSIKETKDELERNIGVVIFWIVWIIVMVLAVFGFYYIDNEWLE
jgi:uncharacterized membrane protein|nr:MAG TPA: hypothetical protein [Caudoviricetes sp.]